MATSNANEFKSEPRNGLTAAAPCYCTSGAGAGVYPSDKPPAYTPQASKDIFKPEVLKYIEERVDKYNDDLRQLSLKIHGTSVSLYVIG